MALRRAGIGWGDLSRGRAQRGLRRAEPRLPARVARARPGDRQPARGSHRHRPSPRRVGRAHPHDPGAPATANRWSLRPGRHVHRRGPGHRHRHRKPHVGAVRVRSQTAVARRGHQSVRRLAEPSPQADHRSGHPPLARVRRRGQPPARRVDGGHPVPHRHRPEMRRRSPGIHPPVRHPGRVDARRDAHARAVRPARPTTPCSGRSSWRIRPSGRTASRCSSTTTPATEWWCAVA